MGRLIEADNLKRHIIETYHDPIIVCNDDEVHFVAEIIDEYPTVEAIPRERIEQMVAEIEKLQATKHFQYKAGQEKGIAEALDIIHKYTKEQNNEQTTD